ncbi:hypothetical protein [Pseudomonas sp. C5pp]|uniref:hypothetical protein n=1 Tax=Pseudomonas sp. C5pp TaxID=1586081 RepID=UPI000AFFB7EE|nr:hypothetical protein [Pseudomonas sp. C5pp]
MGYGAGVTTIELNTGGDGLEFNLHGNWWLPGAGSKTGLRISDISFSTTNNRTGVGLAIYGESVQGRPAEGIYLERIRMRGKSDFNQFWFTALKFRDACPAWIDSPEIHAGNGNDVSTCIEISGTAQGTSPVHYNIISPILYFGLNAIKIGDFVEGVYITQHTIVGCQYGVYWHPSQGESGLSVIGGHIAAVKSAIDLDNVFDFVVEGCLIYRSGDFEPFYGVNISRAGRFSITGNVFRGTSSGSGETGVYVNSSIPDEKYGGVVSSNNFTSFNGRGLWLGANANFVYGSGNRFGACSVRVLRQETSGNCSVDGAKIERSIVVALAGGGLGGQFDVSVPAGAFRIKPAFASADLYGSLSISASYDYDNSTETNLRFVVRSNTGGNISSGNYRFGVCAAESSVSTT